LRNGGVRKREGKPAVFWTAWKGVRRKNCNKTVVNCAAGNGLIFASVVVQRPSAFSLRLSEKYHYRQLATSITSRELPRLYRTLETARFNLSF
jgi:hypothetical protein